VKREEQRRETYNRIVDAAVTLLIETGYSATNALRVQQHVGISRGALLHHFPTSEALSAAAVQRLVEMNIEAIQQELAAAAPDDDPVRRGVRVLHRASTRPSFATELELWAAARADAWLREALIDHERAALRRLLTAVDDLFGPELARRTGYQELVAMTVQLLRGLTVSASLGDRAHDEHLIEAWTAVMRTALTSKTLAPANRS
jgi:AcrR family transcriptional regulator